MCFDAWAIKLSEKLKFVVIGCDMLRTFGHPVATCCDMLGIENRTSAHARVQHCCTKLAKRLQHPLVLHEKFEPTTPNMSQHITTLWPNAHMLRPTMLRYVAMTCCDRLDGTSQNKRF